MKENILDNAKVFCNFFSWISGSWIYGNPVPASFFPELCYTYKWFPQSTVGDLLGNFQEKGLYLISLSGHIKGLDWNVFPGSTVIDPGTYSTR